MDGTLARRFGAVLVAAALVLSACGGGASPTSGTTTTTTTTTDTAGGGATTVDVTLQEWAIVPSVDTAPAGDVTFKLTNSGPDDTHEFVVIKTDLDPGALPTDETGSVDEAGGGMEVMGEVEDVAVGSSEELTLTLAAGNYILLCNIYDETEKEAHYTQGMRIAFTVT
jgi:uncharacterized cupredoxin-like copper-binding protein